MNLISRNVYIDKVDVIVNKYSNTYHKTIKMNPIDANSSTYFDFDKENNKEGPKCKVRDYIRISKYKNIFVKGYVPNWSKEDFMINKVKNSVPLTYFISNPKGKDILRTF